MDSDRCESFFVDIMKKLDERDKHILETVDKACANLTATVKQNRSHLCLSAKSKKGHHGPGSDLVQANIELSKSIELLREDYNAQLKSYREQLIIAKERYDNLMQSYMRMAERISTSIGGSSNEVTIKR